jgi:hypothetical protein
MRNLAELDWCRGQSAETGLNLLDGIWADIYQRFPRRVQSGQPISRNRTKVCLFLPGEMIDHLSVLAILPPGPAFDNMVRVFREFHDHLMFVTHSYAG